MIKLAKVITCLAGMIFVLTGIFAGEALAAGIADTKHNLSSSGTSNAVHSDQMEICIFCHTPHGAIKNDDIPLWNHLLSKNLSYGVYSSPTMRPGTTNGTTTTAGDTDIKDLGGLVGGKDTTGVAVSNLCLSCHDGTVAINSFANPSNQNPTTNMTGTNADGTLLTTSNANLGNLSDDHPVNFTYDVTRVGLNAPASLTKVKLFSGKVQCASCHDPHTSADASGRSFLRMSMDRSGLCLACHNK